MVPLQSACFSTFTPYKAFCRFGPSNQCARLQCAPLRPPPRSRKSGGPRLGDSAPPSSRGSKRPLALSRRPWMLWLLPLPFGKQGFLHSHLQRRGMTFPPLPLPSSIHCAFPVGRLLRLWVTHSHRSKARRDTGFPSIALPSQRVVEDSKSLVDHKDSPLQCP